MGVTSSSLNNIKENEHLLRLTSPDHVPLDDQFWDQLLTFSFSHALRNSDQIKVLDDKIQPLLDRLSQTNSISLNIGTLIKVYINKVSELISSSTDSNSNYNLTLCQAYNALFILRCCTKYFVQTLTEDNVLKYFGAKVVVDAANHMEESGTVIMEQLICTLIETIVDIPVNKFTYYLHVETLNVLVVLFSVQMYSVRPANKSVIYKCLMHKKCSIHALLLTRSLLNNFVKQEIAPKDEGGSLILGLASGFWNVLTLGYGKSDDDNVQNAILARLSLLFLLIITNHCTMEKNPYREALFSCCDTSTNSDSGDQVVIGIKVEFLKLLDTLCAHQNDDQATLLLYMLLHRNSSFRTFVLSRTSELDSLMIPILKILYNSGQRSSHHIYMAVIILLILSEDSLFNEGVHDIMLKNVMWYKERTLSEVSLGGLTILVIIRTIQYNISRTRDKFLHTNLLATLANMSNYFRRLNPYVCQKIVGLFEKISKRMNRIMNQLQQNYNGTGHDHSDQDTDIASIAGSGDVMHDLSIYEEVLRMLLELINACLANQLTHNPNLVYTLLYNRHIFEPFQTHPSFQDVVINIEVVLTYFANRVEGKERTLSVSEVYEIIQHSSLQWPADRLKKFPELKFRYVEDDQPEEFFIPYIWSLVYKSSGVNFSSQNILLFNPHRNVV
ncbi:dymeclin-like protein [Leptotrombidium deliense]|uniref:Dymeclin n=1 Tax=Leptotrombidium deliense TaxID=299467 RepID=A0A443S723_9ACAR|nr:dymeclin-like protein [Leptotrombidium deliense]